VAGARQLLTLPGVGLLPELTIPRAILSVPIFRGNGIHPPAAQFVT
jgi:hypothetical protein